MDFSGSGRTTLFGPPSFYREALALAVPVVLQQLIMNLVSLVDNFMVAGLGDAKMAAINVANQINFVYFIASFTLCAAGGIYLSQFNGSGDPAGMKQAFRFKLIFSLALAAVHLALCNLVPDRLIGIMTAGNAASAEIIREGSVYLRLVSACWVPFAVSSSIGTAFREIGRTKPPLAFSAVAALVNTFLNWVLIYGNLGAPRLEVAGAAYATIIARLVEAAAFLVFARAARPDFWISPRTLFRIEPKVFGGIISKSWLMLLSETTWVMTETVLTALYNGRGGAETVSGMSAAWAIANVFFLVFAGIHTSVGVIVGSALGADRLDEARHKARWLQSGGMIAGFFAAAAQAASAFLVLPLVFGNLSVEAKLIATAMILTVSAYMPLWTLLNAQFAVARSGGDAAMGAIIDIGVNLALFVPGIFVLAKYTTLGPVAMFAIIKATDVLKAWIAWSWLRREHWVKNLTKAEAG
ncbi:MAG: MATE family efflux transporter [Spirochaetes bacterium]|nr:MATE family efflux transporter [Spirochaetota bacterium]